MPLRVVYEAGLDGDPLIRILDDPEGAIVILGDQSLIEETLAHLSDGLGLFEAGLHLLHLLLHSFEAIQLLLHRELLDLCLVLILLDLHLRSPSLGGDLHQVVAVALAHYTDRNIG